MVLTPLSSGAKRRTRVKNAGNDAPEYRSRAIQRKDCPLKRRVQVSVSVAFAPTARQASTMSQKPVVGVVAPCSAVGQVELSLGVDFLRSQGFDMRVHPQCAEQSFTFAGTDQQRLNALLDYAYDDTVDVIWSARGGYGAGRLLPLLIKATAERGVPRKKLLVGYSDVTVLHEWVRKNWNWSTLHAPMPAADLEALKPDEQRAIFDLVRGHRPKFPWQASPLLPITTVPASPIEADLIGGNLALWTTLIGTPFQPNPVGKLLFFEDIGERPYRIDRMVTQLTQSGAFEGVVGLILGDFTDCEDEHQTVRASRTGSDRKPLRRTFAAEEWLGEIFGHLSIPVWKGMPVGHGPNYSPLPLGARYRLSAGGKLELLDWNWLSDAK